MRKAIIITIFSIVLVGGLVSGNWILDTLKKDEVNGVSHLKADFSKIIDNKEIDWIDGEGINHGKVMQYLYVSGAKVKDETDEVLTLRTKNTKVFLNKVDKALAYTYKIFSGTPFYQSQDGWFQTETATTSVDTWKKEETNFLKVARADTIYSSAGDGMVYKDDSGNWATTHDAGAGTTANYTATQHNGSRVDHDGSVYRIFRAFFPFDTSSVADTCTITAATLNLYITSITDGDNDGQDYIQVIQTSQAASNQLVVADYDNVGTTAGATAIDLGSIVLNQYNVWTLNATGRSWIDIVNANNTWLGIREGHDLEDAAIANSTDNGVTNVRYSEYADTTNDPYLSITCQAVVTVVEDLIPVQIWEE